MNLNNKIAHVLWLVLAIAFTFPCFAQKSIILQTRDGIETGYVNEVVEYADGYFVILGSAINLAGASADDLVITKFNDCHEELWSKAYHGGVRVGLDDVVLDGDRLVILIDAYPNNMILSIDLEGEVIFCNRYIYGTHDCFFKLSIVNGNYHVVGHAKGAASSSPKGAIHMTMDRDGKVLSGTLLQVDLLGTDWTGPPYGSGFLSNGTLLRKQGNIYINVDLNNNVLWAKQYDLDGFGLSETAPTNMVDGIVVSMVKNGLTCIVKLGLDGHIVWASDYMELHFHSPEIQIQDNMITVIATEEVDFVKPAVIKLNASNGQIISANSYVIEELNGLLFSEMLMTKHKDLMISGSALLDFSDNQWDDMLIINPKISDCFEERIIPTVPFDEILIAQELDDHFGLMDVTIIEEPYNMNAFDVEAVYFRKCSTFDQMTIDTSLDCNLQYTFNDPYPNANYLWSDGQTDSIRIFDSQTTLTVEIETCREAIQMEVNVGPTHCECMVYLPNVFDPNGFQSVNQQFNAFSNCDFIEYNLSIYDRWGSMVFNSTNETEAWKGRIEDRPLSSGIYSYMFSYSTIPYPQVQYEMGQLTLLR